MDRVSEASVSFGEFVLDLERQQLRTGEKIHTLRPKTFAVLRLFTERPGRLITKHDFNRIVWPDVVVTDDSLVQCIRELRRLLKDRERCLIKTIARRGYLLDCDVERSALRSVDRATRLSGKAPNPRTPSEGADDTRWLLMVLPFAAVDGNASISSLAEAVTDDLIGSLSRLPYPVRIAAQRTAFHDMEDIYGSRLNHAPDVRYLVDGTMRLAGRSLSVTMRLVDGRTGSHLSTDSFELDWDARLLELRNDISARLVSTLVLELLRIEQDCSVRDLSNERTASDLLFRADACWIQSQRGHDPTEPRRLFQEALRRDDRLASAWAGLAMTYLRDIRLSSNFDQELTAARLAAERAMSLKSSNPWSLIAKGWVLHESRRVTQALAAFQHAVQINQALPIAHASVAGAYITLGRSAEALESLRKAMRLSPRHPNLSNWQMFLGVANLHLGNDDDAVEWLTRSVSLNNRDFLSHMFLASGLALVGNRSEARAEAAELLKLKPEFTITRLKASEPSSAPAFVKQRARIYRGLHLAGVP